MEMKKYKLGEICRKITDGSHFSPKEVEDGYPMFSVKDMKEFGFSYDDVKKISAEDFYKLKNSGCVPEKNDVLVAKDGSYLKESFVCEETKNEAILSSIAIFKPKMELVNPIFLSYLFKTPSVYEYVKRGCVSGTALPRIVLKAFKEIDLFLPSLPTQQKIAAVLSSLDKKIALNSCINARLEQMAKRLYEHYFVQFDFPTADGKPYKTSGGKMVYSSELKREIPEGWEVKRLGELNVVSRGTTITQKQTTKGNIKVVAGGLTYSYTNGESNRRKNCITVSGSGENAGFVNFWREPIFASDCSTVQFEDDFDTIICYFNLKMHEHIFFRNSHKSAQPHVYPSDIKEIPFVIPPKEVKEKIKDLFLKANDKIAILQQESARLTSLRDRLLPLLMNGQVSV